MWRADPEGRAVNKGHKGNIEKVTETDKPRQFVRGITIHSSHQNLGLVRHDSSSHAIKPRKTNNEITGEIFMDFEETALIHDHINERIHIIGYSKVWIWEKLIEFGDHPIWVVITFNSRWLLLVVGWEI